MRQMTLRLIEKYQRPVVKLTNFHGLDAMIDTGALYPVWMAGEGQIRRIGGTKKIENVEFGGLGGMTQGSLYELSHFQIGDLIFPNMNIIVHKSDFPVPMLLPATMFESLIYEINNKTHRLNIVVPDDESISRNLKIRSENGQLYIFCSSTK
ncbi:MAG: hypothetical protein J6O04_06775 [Selenomonadaceae bacterium]|nr:hypothetical protein [Selenomonadaceae bacterium]